LDKFGEIIYNTAIQNQVFLHIDYTNVGICFYAAYDKYLDFSKGSFLFTISDTLDNRYNNLGGSLYL